MHRFDIMVSAISIALYHTIKKLVAKKKGCRSDKTDPFRKCHLEKFFLVIHIDICTHIVDKYILFYIYTHTHTPEISMFPGHLMLEKTPNSCHNSS